ncbi:hypothetical protein K1X84_12390 [bacterium]|nr:hypothetical protein [bacterium]
MEYSNFDLNFAGGLLLFIILSAAAVFFSFWTYKETIPPVSKFRRRFLASLRSLAMIVLWFILLEPVLQLTRNEEERPIVAVLIDASESMTIRDQGIDRKSLLQALLSSETLKQMESQNDVSFFSFGDDLREVSGQNLDSIQWSASQTDISSSLLDLKQKMIGKNFASVVLLTDGQYNIGSNPVTEAGLLGVPVFTVGFGSPVETKDILISQVLANEIAYLKSKIPVDVTIASFGFKKKRLTVNILHDNKIIKTQVIDAGDDGSVINVSFELEADTEGLQKYAVSVVPLSGELTDKNNTKSFFVKILKNKMNVLVISGAPGSDHSFLYQTLAVDPNMDVSALIEKKDGSFIQAGEQQNNEPDCFIFNNYPTARSDLKTFQAYVNKITLEKKGWLVFYGLQTDLNKLQQLQAVSPVEWKSDPALDEANVSFNLSLSGKNGAILKVSDNPAETAKQWGELPPVWIARAMANPVPGSDVLARVDMSRVSNLIRMRKDIPLITTLKSGSSKSIAVSAYGLWKTQFIMNGLGRTNEAYQRFVQNAVRWLSTKDDSKQVIITSAKQLYRNGEKILFSAQVYDEQLHAVSDAEVKLKVTSENGTTDLQLDPVGNGRYEGSINGLNAGDYVYSGDAIRNETLIGTDKGKLTVENYSIELIQTSMNEKLLRSVAQESGGEYYSPDQFGDIIQRMKFKPLVYEKNEELELWNKTMLLFLFAGLVSLEWFIRKRSDMM